MNNESEEIVGNVTDEIKRLHNEVEKNCRRTLEAAQEIGRLLAAQKAKLPHGTFSAWIEKHLPFTPRTGQTYMRLWERRAELKNEATALLTVTAANALLTAPKEDRENSDGESSYIPPDGYALVGEVDLRGLWSPVPGATVATVLIEPSLNRDFFHMAVEWSLLTGGATVDYLKRAIRRDRIKKVLSLWCPPAILRRLELEAFACESMEHGTFWEPPDWWPEEMKTEYEQRVSTEGEAGLAALAEEGIEPASVAKSPLSNLFRKAGKEACHA